MDISTKPRGGSIPGRRRRTLLGLAAFLSSSWPKISTDPLLNAAKQEAAA
jgi:hypothetical protein